MPKKLENILAAHGVNFREGGSSEVLTRCPLCGDADPSEHLSINLQRRGWRCLRNPHQHRGKSYVYLLTLLLRCSEDRARELLGVREAAPLPSADDFSQQWRKQLGYDQNETQRPSKLTFPKEIKPLTPGAPRSGGFWDYLTDSLPDGRGFTREQAEWVAETYKLHYATSGRFAYRVIIPIFDRLGNLQTWTGRSLDPEASIRYLTLRKEEALAPPGNLLLSLPILARAEKRRCLSICEGPFDAIAVTALGHRYGVWGTCLFGLELSEAQSNLIYDISESFDRVRLLIDPREAWLRNLSIKSGLPRRAKPQTIPDGFKDPGEFVASSSEATAFIRSLAG